MFTKGLLPIPEDSDRVTGVGSVQGTQHRPSEGKRAERDASQVDGWCVHLYSEYSTCVQCVQCPVAGHNPSVTERASERMGLDTTLRAVRALLWIAGPV